MALEQYEGPGEIQFDNSTLAEATSLSIQVNGNNNPVTTMKKGLSGRSRGAVTVDIQVENAVPKGGLEKEFIEKCVENADVQITHLYAGRQYIYPGYIDSVDAQQGVDAPASISFTVVAQPPTIV
jgi:hypothetical protein